MTMVDPQQHLPGHRTVTLTPLDRAKEHFMPTLAGILGLLAFYDENYKDLFGALLGALLFFLGAWAVYSRRL